MPDRAVEEKQLFYMEFIHRENQFRHQTRDADKLQYELLRDANPKAVEGMLRYSDYSYSDIGNILAFCSQSLFISVFRKETGLTPRQYRARYGR